MAGSARAALGDVRAGEARGGGVSADGVGRAEQELGLGVAAVGVGAASGGGVARLFEPGARAGVELRRRAAERRARGHQLGAQQASDLQRLPLQERAPRLRREAVQRTERRGVGTRASACDTAGLVLGLGDRALQRARGAGAGGGGPVVGGLAVEQARVVPAQLGVGGGGARVGRARERALERGADVLGRDDGDGPAGRRRRSRRRPRSGDSQERDEDEAGRAAAARCGC